jgi:pyruvate kinase
MEKYRSLLSQPAFLIAKLERQSAIEDVAKIADLADELWLCRGDLGAELGLKTWMNKFTAFLKMFETYPSRF